MKPPRGLRALLPGERFRLDGGSVWLCERTTGCSALIRCVGGVIAGTRTVQFRDGREREFPMYDGHRVGERMHVSPRAVVERIES